ncbi:hypothetical protein KS4_04980 [Poriferisphaera corsica]|uniref:Cohesin domain-containing protein n=1 Tax=Poriferisphaera corsica TaxID=2528020 RepID=A0A517YQG1_9BACT|nr:hypothetical protein [Poriferisphaera corsica]QDU32466.1 hypothetical protein KS4_04980 [Poriferisphaera corsica]
MRKVLSVAVGTIASFGLVATSQAAPVQLDVQGVISNISLDTGELFGPVSVGDAYTLSYVFDVTDDNYTPNASGVTGRVDSPFLSASLTINDVTYDIGITEQFSTISTSGIFGSDDLLLSFTPSGSEQANARLVFPPDAFTNTETLEIPGSEQLVTRQSEAVFGLASDFLGRGTVTSFDVTPVAAPVPTPAAFGASALLLPLLLRRQQQPIRMIA